MPDNGGPVRLPIVQSIEITNFTLYRENPHITLTFGEGVFCLAGANGLGKSTFLAILNYAITGIVADPHRKFRSLKEYYKDSRNYSNEYFAGRIFELARHLAEVSIELTVGAAHYSLTRGIFEPDALRKLKIIDAETGEEWSRDAEPADEGAAISLHDHYVRSIVEHANLATFDQLVFLQHFLLTFDERRQLLFWDAELARQALFLAFGVDGDRASNADEWRRIADRLESQARQAQYQATTARQRKNELLRPAGDSKLLDPDLLLVHRELVDARDRAEIMREDKSRNVSDAQLSLTRLTAKEHALTNDYDRAFSDRLRPGADPRQNPLVNTLIMHRQCGVCGSHGDEIARAALQALDEARCPLCQTPAHQNLRTTEEFRELQKLDEELAAATQQVDVAQQTLSRLTVELEKAEASYTAARDALADFEKENDISAQEAHHGESDDVLGSLIKQLDGEQRSATERRDEFRIRRDEYRTRLLPIQTELAERYFEAEKTFVPKFQKLAHQFLGLDLVVNLEQSSRGPELSLEIDGTRRRITTQLSESQRYFVDIALRMALAQHMVGDGNPTCLYIDTPEGSLDIAYENRAGNMFGQFAGSGNKLVMTANINSSRLVQQLAHICGADRMKIERMTEWTTLSEVQAESEELFDEAYEHITEALLGKLLR